MARYRRRDAVEARLSDDVRAEGRTFSADLIAKRATGIEGYRMTVAFLEREGEGHFFVELEPAPTREEAQRRAEELQNDVHSLRELLSDQLTGSA